MMLDKGLIKYYIINSISEESKPSAGASKIWRKAPIFCNKNKNHNNNINNNNSYNKRTLKVIKIETTKPHFTRADITVRLRGKF